MPHLLQIRTLSLFNKEKSVYHSKKSLNQTKAVCCKVNDKKLRRLNFFIYSNERSAAQPDRNRRSRSF